MKQPKKAPATKRGGKRTNAPRRRAPYSKSVVKTLGLPDKMIAKLPYTDLQAITGTSPVNWYAQKAYNINSLYDPETGALNQQNLYFKQYMSIYQSFRVFKVDYSVTLYNTANSSACAGSISFDPQGSQMQIGDISQLSKPYSKRFTLAPAGNTGSQKTIKGSIYIPRIFGLTPEQYRTNVAYAGGEGQNPALMAQMSINLQNVNSGQGVSIQADVRYTCHVEFFGRDTLQVVGTDAPIEEA